MYLHGTVDIRTSVLRGICLLFFLFGLMIFSHNKKTGQNLFAQKLAHDGPKMVFFCFFEKKIITSFSGKYLK